jgi:AraC-like DNA-binding protein
MELFVYIRIKTWHIMKKELAFPQLIPLHIGYAERNGDWNFKNISSPFSRIYLVTQGEGMVYMNGRSYPLTPGHLYLIPPFSTHTDSCQGLFCHYYAHVFETMVDRKYSIFEHFTFPFEVESSAIDELLMKHLAEINLTNKLRYSDPRKYDNPRTLMQMLSQDHLAHYADFLETRGILLQLFSRFLQKTTVASHACDGRLMKATQFIRDHVKSEVSVRQLAALCCMNVDYFIRLFRKNFGVTPLSFIQQKKMERAQILFIFEDLSVEEVAYELGYNNVSYFIRLFKQMVGQTPLEYKRDVK